MSAISGTRRALKEMADGTLRVQIDIDPRFKAQFHELFPNIDMPVALAPLVSDFERIEQKPEEKPKGGPLAKLAGMWCKDETFHEYFSQHVDPETHEISDEGAADYIRAICRVDSRAEIDSNGEASVRFHEYIRQPYMDWLKEQGL
jgi:hypothetical protein